MATLRRFALWHLSEYALTGKYRYAKGRDDRERATNDSVHDFTLCAAGNIGLTRQAMAAA